MTVVKLCQLLSELRLSEMDIRRKVDVINISFTFQKLKLKLDLTFGWRMSLSVHRPAVATPSASSGLSVVEFFTEKLKTSNVVLAPPTFELSGDPNKVLGEEAEKKVID